MCKRYWGIISQLVQNRESQGQVSDEKVVELVVSGDIEAFELLVERHQDSVARIVAAKVPGQEVAEVAHQVFIRAFLSLPGYTPKAPFFHWLATLATRTCYDYWRDQSRNREMPFTALSEAQRNWLASRISNRDAGRGLENENLLYWALGHLSPGDRMALNLVYLEGYSVTEAAQLMGWSKANVKVRCFRARKRLRRLIAGELSGR